MKTRIIFPAALALSLLYLASAPSASAFELFDRVLGGSAQKGSTQKGYGCDCGTKELTCGMEPSCGCGAKTRSRHHRMRRCGCNSGCGARQKGVFQKGVFQKGGASQKGCGAAQKGAAQKGCGATQKGASQKGCGASQKGCGASQKGCGCGRTRTFWHGRGCGCDSGCGGGKLRHRSFGKGCGCGGAVQGCKGK